MEKDKSLIRYVRSIPDILRYQIVTKCWLGLLALLLRLGRSAVLWTGSRSALSSGDLPFLMTSPQGWAVIVLGILMLLLYMVFDVNAMILLSSRLIHQEKIVVREIMREAFQSLKRLKEPAGAFLVMYVAFLMPIAGVGLGISLTDSLYIPDFITSVIEAHALYNALYTAGLLVIFFAAFYYIFTFHCIVIGGQKAGEGRKRAGRLMHSNWKNFLKRYLSFFLKTLLIGIALVMILALVLFGITAVPDITDEQQFRVLITFCSFLILTAVELYAWIFTPFQFMELTRIYESYTEEDEGPLRYPQKRSWKVTIAAGIVWTGFLFLISMLCAYAFDEVFPKLGGTEIIAHRAGGSLGNENTVLGLNLAIEAGAKGGEIDVQRTKDGYYVLNHDNDLKRLTGVSKRVCDLTLEEIRQLRVPDNFNLRGEDTDFALFEEILDAAKGKIHLYVELKGETADRQMGEDLYAMVCERDMLGEVTFICLNYPLIEWLEEQHPDAQTGYLCFAALGEVENLQVDELILEEEMATPVNIDAIHAAGKTVSVWTVNNAVSMVRFYARGADAIITDEVEQALKVRDILLLSDDGEFADQLQDAERVILKTLFVWWPK